MKATFQDVGDLPEAAQLVKARTQIGYLTVLSSLPQGLLKLSFLLTSTSLHWALTSAPDRGYILVYQSPPSKSKYYHLLPEGARSGLGTLLLPMQHGE